MPNLEVPFIASIKYRNQIDTLCSQLKKLTSLDYFVVYLLFKNGKRFVLSNMYHILEDYYLESYYKQDYSISDTLISNRSHYICDQVNSVSPQFQDILTNKFNVHRTFYTIRNTEECTFVFGGATKNKIADSSLLYKKCKDKFDDFCVNFIRDSQRLIIDHNSELKNAIILNDRAHLIRCIKNPSEIYNELSTREIECITWAAKGKTSLETALILNISSETVNKYRRSVIKKLDCTNLCHAVYKAVCYGYLDACQPPYFNPVEQNYRNVTSPTLSQYNNLIHLN